VKIPTRWMTELKHCVSYCRGCLFDDFDNFTTLRDYLLGIGFPERYFDTLDDLVECRHCGTKVGLDDDIVGQSIDDEIYEALADEIEGRYRNELIAFAKFLEEYPYLGMKHPVGIEISEEIASLDLACIENQNWFRARIPIGGQKFSSDQMGNPNPNNVVVGEGRFNHFGQSRLYLGSTENVCLSEISGKGDVAWMQVFRIVKLEKVLDLSNIFAPNLPELKSLAFASINYTGTISAPVRRDQNWKPEYFIPRFIADLARELGINAIRYRSSVDLGDNLVIFTKASGQLELVDEPYLYQYMDEEVCF